MSKILVVLGNSYASAVEGLGEIVTDANAFLSEEHPDDYSLILFTGGEDVTPSLYGETSPDGLCFNCEQRDAYETKIYKHALENGIRMTGICRGIQFLNVMAGGKMYHHVDRHTGTKHPMQTLKQGLILVNSLHHQMVIPPEEGIIIGGAQERRSAQYIGDGDLKTESPELEAEAVILPHIDAAGVQYHPEMMSKDSEGYKWFHELAKDLIETEHFTDIIDKYAGEQWDTKQLIQSAQ